MTTEGTGHAIEIGILSIRSMYENCGDFERTSNELDYYERSSNTLHIKNLLRSHISPRKWRDICSVSRILVKLASKIQDIEDQNVKC